MTVVEHAGKGVLTLNRYPWQVELTRQELLALAELVSDPGACRAASALAGNDRRAGLLQAIGSQPEAGRRLLYDQCIAVADRLSPAGWPDEPTVLPRDCAGTSC